ncbi:MAG: precorrin-3B C(17)-methyltransferase [Bacillota bacterium]
MLYITGIGPGSQDKMTGEAIKIIQNVEVIVGYKTYLKLIKDLISENQITYTSGMREEKDRIQKAIEYAASGNKTAIISSGDAGVYGMAGPVMELIAKNNLEIDVQVIPGVPAANGAAAVLGAPLMHDYATISLSDILTPWEQIKKRVRAAAEADFVTVLYNPRSSRRKKQLKFTKDFFLEKRSPEIPLGIVRNISRDGQEKILTTLKKLPLEKVDMLTIVIIGNSQSYISKDKIITPRGYKL